MALEEYRKKRDFKQTPEPSGSLQGGKSRKGKKKTAAKGNSFVIQKHAATRLHYDFRLELDGVLLSWAVPKGPSLDPDEKRLAVHVEDHPVDYGDFEGVIPRGQYGGGTVLLWDRGTWEVVEGDPAAAYRKGHLKFRLDGEKLQGGWNLVRMGGRRGKDQEDGEEKENWLLIKEKDEAAVPGSGDAIVAERQESVASGRDMEEIAADRDRVWQSDRPAAAADKAPAGSFRARIRAAAEKAAARAAKPSSAPKAKAPKTKTKTSTTAKMTKAKTVRSAKATKPAKLVKAPAASTIDPTVDASAIPRARKAPLPTGGLEPQLATLVAAAPGGEGWLHEIKYDGYRVLAEIAGGKVHLWTRRGKDWTARFSPIARACEALPARSALLDGEVVVLGPDGTTSFQALQNALSGQRDEDLIYFVFDLLHLDGWDLRRAALADRKKALAELLAGLPAAESEAVRYSDHVEGGGAEFYRQACNLSLEGMISKRADLPYRSGRSKDWLKVKCTRRQELVVVGYTDPEGSRSGFGSLLLAVHEDGELVYAGKVGTGFDEASLADLSRRLKKLDRKTPAFANPPRGAEARRSHWVSPELVAEVAFTEWTEDGVLRHPSFQGLREDKLPAEVVHERPEEPPSGRPARKKTMPTSATRTAKATPAKPTTSTRTSKATKSGESEVAGVRLSHPDKVLYPDRGLTKRDLALFYEKIADHILPHIADRPLTLVRCPEGQSGECFYQKHVGDSFPQSIRRVDVGEAEPYGSLDSLAGLVALVQVGVLELHIWGAHRDDVEKPDYLVFDLDPDEGLAWERVALGALQVRSRLEELGLRSFLKTTGGKGLHVVVPLTRRLGWDAVKPFTKALAESVVAAEPGLYTSILSKARRRGKTFIDYLRNGRGATSIAPFSTRSRPGAPVSTPLAWEELANRELRGNTYTVENLPARLAKLAHDPWADFFKVRQSVTVKMLKSLGLS